MRKIKVIFILTWLMMACSRDFIQEVSINENKPHFVTRAEALSKAQNMLSDRISRGKELVVDSYEFYTINSQTRSSSDPACFHIFNFVDDGGFAMVSADNRTTDIYAYSDHGYLNTTDNALRNSGVSVFMEGAVTYYNHEIETFGLRDSLIQNPIDGPIIDLDQYTTVDTIDFHRIAYVAPLLTTNWGQNEPYNMFCPIVDNLETPTGCVPTAIAQIMAYHEYPTSVDDYVLDWTRIKSSDVVSCNDDYAPNVAYFMRKIGDVAESQYAPGGTSTYAVNIVPTFEYFGYHSSGLMFYDEDESMSSLNMHWPICTMGASANAGHAWVVDGYDLYHKTAEYYNYYLYIENPFKTRVLEEKVYMHCNWGWDGIGYIDSPTGFYLSGAFKEYTNNVKIIPNIRVVQH